MSHSKLARFGVFGVLWVAGSGCAHTVIPPVTPAPSAETKPDYPMGPPTFPNFPKEVVILPEPPHPLPQDHAEFPCGHSMTVKVGKLEVDMPKGGSLEIAGVKGSTNAYHIILEGVEFTNTDHCH